MSNCYLHQLVWILICWSAVLISTAHAGYVEPVSVWPLNKETQGYDILQDIDTAKLADVEYLDMDGYTLNGTSFVDIPLNRLDKEDKTTVVVSINFANVDSGVIFNYMDDVKQNSIQSELDKGFIQLRYRSDWDECNSKEDLKLSTGSVERLAIQIAGDKISINKYKDKVCELKFDKDQVWGNGILRIGSNFKVDTKKALRGTISCIRLYKSDCAGEGVKVDVDCHRTGKYSGPYPCMSFPCQHGGTCSNSNVISNDYICQCVSGYTGKNCEENINDCEPNPCSNEGICLDAINSFTCNCSPFFTGELCEEETKLPRDRCTFKMFKDIKPSTDETVIRDLYADGDIECGAMCRKTESCRSFVFKSTQPKCTLYTSTQAQTVRCQSARYYIMNPN